MQAPSPASFEMSAGATQLADAPDPPTTRGEDEVLYRQFQILSSPRLSEEKAHLAAGLLVYVDEARDPSGLREEGPASRASKWQVVQRQASGAARPILAAGAESPENLRGLRTFLAACQKLLARVLSVQNFDKPAAHALFCLVETSILPLALHDLDAAGGSAGSPRDGDVTRVSSCSKRAPVDRDAMLASMVVLAMGEFPVARLAEILGFAEALARALTALSFGRPTHARYRRAWHTLRRASVDAERAGPGPRDGAQIFVFCVNLLARGAASTPSATRKRAIRIFEEKARYAMLHHKNEVLGERRLVEWFSDTPFRAEEMLGALYDSPWIDKDDIGRSRFFTLLTCRAGKMDGVFLGSELAILKSHLASLPAASDVGSDDAPARYIAFASARRRDEETAAPTVISPHDHRAMFFHLLDVENRPSAIGAATRVVAQTLAELTALRRAAGGPPLFAALPYEKAALEERISQIYWHQAEHVRRMRLDFDDGELRRFHLYFAPFALIDGCWLRNAAADKAGNDVRLALYGIYSDEIGNGHHPYNHANIYGRLLGELGFAIASVNELSPAIAAKIPQLAFKAPAFLLALCLAHADYFPELLGVTLAIELSGLDGLYEAMIGALESKGYSASFWRLHVSVDNYSTGHARQSLEACIDFMQEVQLTYGHASAAPAWERIWSGFLTMLYLFDVELRTLMGVKEARSWE
jgi:hypothetical protein